MIEIYTDGACILSYGGYAALIDKNGDELIVKGAERHSTNNRMEIMAAIEALRAIEPSDKVTLYSDSIYLIQGIKEWLPKWKNNGWRASDRKPVKNQDLWETLDTVSESFDIKWKWVKGHDGDSKNEKVDKLAYIEAKTLMETYDD